MLKRAIVCAILTVGASAASASERTLTVLAAVSLRESFQESAKGFETHHKGIRIRLSFAGSQQLAGQILLGAPVDVFASADEVQMRRVLGLERMQTREAKIFAYNRLAMIVSMKAEGRIKSLKDLGKPGTKIVVGEPNLPIGEYTRQVMERASKQMEQGWMALVRKNVVSKELDVRAISAKIQLGEADAGFVYITDASAAKGKVVTRPIPDAYNVRANYLIVPVSDSTEAREFVSWVRGNFGRRSLLKRGFELPRLQ